MHADADAMRRGNALREACLLAPVFALSVAPCLVLADPPHRAAGDSPIEEILVTARKMPERLADIPMSVQVVAGELVDEQGLGRLFDLQFNVPGLVVNNLGGFGAGLSLRGVSNQGADGAAVAAHLDGIYLGDTNLALARLFDVERIEVLKGPQGTLYGRNSTGGSVNILTRAPEQQFDAALEIAYGSFSTTRIDGHLNVPFERSALRLSVAGADGDGYIRNAPDDRRFAEDDFRAARFAWRFEPDDAVRLDLMVQAASDDGASGELWLPNPAFLPDPADIHVTSVTLPDPFLELDSRLARVSLEVDLGFAVFTALAGDAKSEVRNRDDCAGLPFLQGCVRELKPAIARESSQEVRLASHPDARRSWLAGLYHFDDASTTRFFQKTSAAAPLPTNDATWTSATDAWAAFGQLTQHVGTRWALTGGLRYSVEDRQVTEIGTGTGDSAELTSASNDWDQLSWRVDVEYEAAERLRVFAGASTGFKSGGVTTERLPDGTFDAYDEEDLLALEAGIKWRGAGDRFALDASVFHYDFDDLQVATTYFDGADVITEIDNAARAAVLGVDLAGGLKIGAHWTVSGGMVWMPRREFVEFSADGDTGDLSGNDLSRAPEWLVTSAIDYVRPLPRFGVFRGRIEYQYRSDFYFTKENLPLFSQPGFGLLNAFLRYEASAGWYLFAAAKNITDTAYFTQVFIQSSAGYPVTFELGFGLEF